MKSLKIIAAAAMLTTAFAGMASPSKALAFFRLARASLGQGVTSFELIPRIGVDFVLAHARGARDPLTSPHPWYVLIEAASQSAG